MYSTYKNKCLRCMIHSANNFPLENQGITRNTRHVRLRTKHFGVSRSSLEHALCMRFEK